MKYNKYMDLKLEKRTWWNYIEEDLQELVLLSESLINMVGGSGKSLTIKGRELHDYSFIVFPIAKAYEGFLKKMFLDMGLITKEDYLGKLFRIGKALNPYLESKYRDQESVYDKLAEHCGGERVPQVLWNAWVKGRNLLFHWFPEEKRAVSFEEAQERIILIVAAMDVTLKECMI